MAGNKIRRLVMVNMNEDYRTELVKWRWTAIVVTVLGILLFAAPWIPKNYKYIMAIPVYAMFFYVYYKYISVKKGGQQTVSNSGKMPVSQSVKQAGGKTGKASKK